MASGMRREFVGHVFVDHGGVVVLDPEYAELSDGDRDRVIDASTGATLDCDDDNLPPGMDHIGVFVSTGLGDGRYPVYADLIELPGAGTRVARIVIDCLGTEPETQSDDLRAEMIDAADLLRQHGIDVALPYDEHQHQGVDDDVRRRALGDDA